MSECVSGNNEVPQESTEKVWCNYVRKRLNSMGALV